MECRNIQNLMIDFIDGNISGDMKEQIEKHLLVCKTCRDEHMKIKHLQDDLKLIEDEVPSEKMKSNFYAMLEQEKKQLKRNKISKEEHRETKHLGRNFMKYAATTIILVSIGFLLGQQMQLRNSNQEEIALLRQELNEMQQNFSMASLTNSTASQRLKAVNTISDQIKPDDKMINTLISTLMNDENVNVKMAAANALAKYPENKKVRDVLIESLQNEEDPALQITLIGILTQIQDKRAKNAFQNILQNDHTIPVVKQQAEEGLKVFI